MARGKERRVRAAVVQAPGGSFVLETVELEAPRADEVLVRIVACGICHTDVVIRDAAQRTPKPVVLGHEGAGIVEAVGSDVRQVQPGDAVVLSFASCGTCRNCVGARPAYCSEWSARNFGGSRSDGSTALRRGDGSRLHSHFFGQSAFATHAVVPARSLVKVAHGLPLELLAPLGCGVQTGAGAILRSLQVGAGARVLVMGAGSVGLAAVMAARLVGASAIVAVDIQPSRLALARELGATRIVDAGRGRLEIDLADALPDGADFALDTTGRADTIAAAIGALSTGSVCGLLGMSAGPIALDTRSLMVGGRSLRGIVEGDSDPQILIPELIAHFEAGRLPVDRLVRTYPFDAINEAVHDMEQGRAIKPVLLMPTPISLPTETYL